MVQTLNEPLALDNLQRTRTFDVVVQDEPRSGGLRAADFKAVDGQQDRLEEPRADPLLGELEATFSPERRG
jgi:hypothetical protein